MKQSKSIYGTKKLTISNYRSKKTAVNLFKKEVMNSELFDKGYKQRITRLQNISKQISKAKGVERKILLEKYDKGFKSLIKKQVLRLNEKTNTLKKFSFKDKMKVENGKLTLSYTAKFKTSIDYGYTGSVFSYDAFKQNIKNLGKDEYNHLITYLDQFTYGTGGKYDNWTNWVKEKLDLDDSVSLVKIKGWIRKYEAENRK